VYALKQLPEKWIIEPFYPDAEDIRTLLGKIRDKNEFTECFAAAENWFKPPMFFIDRTKAVIQHLLEKSFK